MASESQSNQLDSERFPIGKYNLQETYSESELKDSISYLANFPTELAAVCNQLTEDQLHYTYRTGGWTAKQVIHHIADSHINAYVRVKLALTSDTPHVSAYNESAWASMIDTSMCSIQDSLSTIIGVHSRLCAILQSLTPDDMNKTYFHTGYQKHYRMSDVCILYAWHAKHHLEHIKRCTIQP